MILHDKIAEQLPAWRERIRILAKDHADVAVEQVTIGQIVGGMRDIKSLLTDISYVDPAEGIRFRGMSIPEALKALPKNRGNKMPLARSGSGMGEARRTARLCLQDVEGHAEGHAPDDPVHAGGDGDGARFGLYEKIP